jgi:predicted Rossmann-fold nucleotide-binding protein
VQWVILSNGDERIALMNSILQHKQDTRFVVSGAGLGTLDELFKFVYINPDNQKFLTILNSTRFSKALMMLMSAVGIQSKDNYLIYP